MSEEAHEVQSLNRRTAKSGKVSYGDSVLLHESSRTRVLFVPFFISHSDRTELAAKITTYRKQPPPNDWGVVEEKSVSLSEDSTRRLFKGMQAHLAIAQEKQDGQFLLIRVSEGTAQLGNHNPSEVAAALTRVLSQDEIIAHLKDTELTTELTSALKGAIRMSEMKLAVVELRRALDEGENSENTYQRWCEDHSWAFGNAYVVRDEIRQISTGDHLDLLLPNVIAGYRDLVELKRPDMDVLLWDDKHKNYYFSSEVSKAVGQCHRYLDVLHEEATKGLRDHPEIVAYHPRATIVIGRSVGWSELKLRSLHGLNSRLSGVNVMTYDHLLAQGERLVELLSPKTLPPSSESDDEDMPF